MIILKIAKT
ncbi:hypothetical protein F383_03333 [Gossypium arboreum]|uniref:Uncharacterized protein n=1 Tax=Gossypium arboreum TaxID=29729 RepID=A0A0B0NX15_GOSAR|nr:hypothetical protein F383_03333 [Gossypium arboreum]